jgi:rRNA maturation protein Rpf1
MKPVYLSLNNSIKIPNTEFTVASLKYKEAESALKSGVLFNQRVVITSNLESASFALALAYKYKKTALIDGNEFVFVPNADDVLSERQAKLLFVEIAKNPNQLEIALKHCVRLYMELFPSKMRLNDIKKNIFNVLPSFEYMDTRKLAERIINDQHKEKLQQVKDYCSSRINGVTTQQAFSSSNLKEIVSKVENTECQVIVLQDPHGKGKSKVVKSLVEYYEQLDISEVKNNTNKLNPYFAVVITPSVSLSSNFSTTSNFYKNNDSRISSSYVVCQNTALLNDYDFKSISKSKRIFFEEFEEIMNNCASDHMGETIIQKGKAIDNALKLFKQAASSKDQKIFIAAADLSNFTSEMLLKTGVKMLFINLTDGFETQPKHVDYVSIEENIAICNRKLKEGKTVFVGHTGSFNETRRTLIEDAYAITETREVGKKKVCGLKLKYKPVVAEFLRTEEGKVFINDLDLHFELNKFTIASRCIMSGLSITAPIDHFANFACANEMPNSTVQCDKRPRNNTYQSFSISERRSKLHTRLEIIYAKEIVRGHSVQESDDKYDVVRNYPGVQEILERIQYMNKIKNDYANVVLLTKEFFGDIINYDSKHNNEEVKNYIKEARICEKIERKSYYFEKVSFEEKDAIESKSEDERTNVERMKMWGETVKDFFNIESKSTKQFKEALAYAKRGKGLACLSSLNKLRDEGRVDEDAQKSSKTELLNKLFEVSDLDAITLSGTISQSQLKEFKKFIITGNVSETLTAESVFLNNYSDIDLKSTPKYIVSEFLYQALGLKLGEGVVNKNVRINGKRTSTTTYPLLEKPVAKLNKFYSMAYAD